MKSHPLRKVLFNFEWDKGASSFSVFWFPHPKNLEWGYKHRVGALKNGPIVAETWSWNFGPLCFAWNYEPDTPFTRSDPRLLKYKTTPTAIARIDENNRRLQKAQEDMYESEPPY
jgi:hypothetical protein